MANYYIYDRDRGIITVDTSTLLTDVQNEYKTALGTDLDLSPQTPQGRLIDAETLARTEVLNFSALMANQLNPEENGGQFLASTFSLMGGTPFKAVPTVLKDARVYGTQGTSAPSGMRIYDGSGNYFVLQSAVSIAAADGAEYYGLGTFQAEVAGPIPAPANSSWIIEAPAPANVTKVTNPSAGTTGSNAENDVQARNRRRNILAKQSSNTVRATRARVSDLPGFLSMTIRENDKSTSQVIDNITLPPKSIYICVQGAVDADVAAAILEAKGCGAMWTIGTPEKGVLVSVVVTEPDSGQPYTVIFARPVVQTCAADVWYDVKQGFGNYEPEFAIQDAIQRYQRGEMPGYPGAVLGRNLSAYELAGSVSYFYPGLYVSSLTLTGKTIDDGVEIPAELWEVLEIPVGNVVVHKRA